jgi:outer membrane biogenesis lipoprotein LolB
MSFVYLVGCTTVSVPPMETPTHSNKTNLKNLNDFESWNIQGAIAVKTEQKGWNASFNWSQKYDHYYLNIT